MSQTTAIPMVCQQCGRPCASGTWIGSSGPYHLECTRGPDYKPEVFQPLPSGFRPEAIELLNRFAEALSGEPEIRKLSDELQRHHILAADARALIHNGGAGPNLSQLKRVDAILREIAGLPPETA